MRQAIKEAALVVTSHEKTPTVAELERAAEADERPRKDYVELAKLIDSDIIDIHYMRERAHPLARLVAERASVEAGQIAEVWLRRNRYRHILAWSDRIGLPLALVFKATRSRGDLNVVSTWASRPKKAVMLQYLKAHTHTRTLFMRSLQAEIAENRLGVPKEKLRVEPRGVDERFWRPAPDRTPENLLCSVGWEARDYRTLIDALRGMDVRAELAVGAIAKPLMSQSGEVADTMREIAGEGLPQNVTLTQKNPRELRELYWRSKLAVVTVKHVEFDAGVTAITEAMALGKAVVATRTPGIADLFEHGVEGLYVRPGDVGEMKAAIQRLLDHPEEAARMGQAGRERVMRHHRLEECMRRLAEVIRASA